MADNRYYHRMGYLQMKILEEERESVMEFDTELQEVYIILSKTQPEIVDFTFYTDLETVNNRVDELNKLAKSREYWHITMYRNSRNSEKDGEMVPKNI